MNETGQTETKILSEIKQNVIAMPAGETQEPLAQCDNNKGVIANVLNGCRQPEMVNTLANDILGGKAQVMMNPEKEKECKQVVQNIENTHLKTACQWFLMRVEQGDPYTLAAWCETTGDILEVSWIYDAVHLLTTQRFVIGCRPSASDSKEDASDADLVEQVTLLSSIEQGTASIRVINKKYPLLKLLRYKKIIAARKKHWEARVVYAAVLQRALDDKSISWNDLYPEIKEDPTMNDIPEKSVKEWYLYAVQLFLEYKYFTVTTK